jgi:hypothetical protein
MSTKKQTKTTATFDPTGLSAYQGLQSSILGGLQENMNNPFQAMGFNQQVAAGNQSVFGTSQQNNTNAAESLAQRGISANSGIFAQTLNNVSNSTAQMKNNMNNNLLLGAGQVAQSGATAAGQYQPLQTGNNNTVTNSGIGSWLTPLLGSLASAAGGAAGAG